MIMMVKTPGSQMGSPVAAVKRKENILFAFRFTACNIFFMNISEYLKTYSIRMDKSVGNRRKKSVKEACIGSVIHEYQENGASLSRKCQ